MELLLHSKPYKVKMQIGGKPVNLTFEGIVDKFTRKYITRRREDLLGAHAEDGRAVHDLWPVPAVQRRAAEPGGARLQDQRLQHRRTVGDGSGRADRRHAGDRRPGRRADASQSLTERLQHLIDIGLEYLSLNRETDTLSGGESQRVKMVKHLSSSLVDVMYIFDEPSIGLHPRDVHRLNELLQKLRDKGNTVIVVEHDPDVIKVADHIVDVGPHAGSARRRRSSTKAASTACWTPTR